MHPATGVQWNKQERANRAIPFAEFPAWAAQVNAIEQKDALRAAYHRLCVLTGTWRDLVAATDKKFSRSACSWPNLSFQNALRVAQIAPNPSS
jgi:hypothetical protein